MGPEERGSGKLTEPEFKWSRMLLLISIIIFSECRSLSVLDPRGQVLLIPPVSSFYSRPSLFQPLMALVGLSVMSPYIRLSSVREGSASVSLGL